MSKEKSYYYIVLTNDDEQTKNIATRSTRRNGWKKITYLAGVDKTKTIDISKPIICKEEKDRFIDLITDTKIRKSSTEKFEMSPDLVGMISEPISITDTANYLRSLNQEELEFYQTAMAKLVRQVKDVFDETERKKRQLIEDEIFVENFSRTHKHR